MEFKEYKLSDLTINGKGEYGIGASAVEYNPSLYRYLRITDIDDNGFINTDELKSVNDKNAENYLLKENEIVFARTGNSTGKSYFYNGEDGPLVFAGFLIRFKLDSKKVNPKFIRYYTLSENYKGWINQFATGSTRKNINAKTYGNMIIKLPPRSYQNYIVQILDSLEEKLKENKKIIANLEELSKTLFKRWFVDFEFPDENGNPYKSSGGEMVDSELGKIPKGWECVYLKDIVHHKKDTFNPKKSNESEVKHFSLPAFDSGQYPTIDNVTDIKSNKWIIDENCILFSKMNPTTRRIWVTSYNENFLNVASSEFVVLKSDNSYRNAFIYNICISDKFNEYLVSNTTGSTNSRQRVKPDIAVQYRFAYNEEVSYLLSEKIEPYIEKIKIIREQNQNLTQLRDTLLPKLMSGEIEIPDDIEVNEDELSI